MPRIPRRLLGGYCYHVINRANARRELFRSPGDYRAFLETMAQACERRPVRILAVCIMPNHFHLVLWPEPDQDLSRFMHWWCTTHSVRYRSVHGQHGRLWQGRFKSFPAQEDEHLLGIMRYVERNPLRAGLVRRAEHWSWGSLRWRLSGNSPVPIQDPPCGLPPNWADWVNAPQTPAELAAIRRCVNRERPYGQPAWTRDTARKLGRESSLGNWRRR